MAELYDEIGTPDNGRHTPSNSNNRLEAERLAHEARKAHIAASRTEEPEPEQAAE